MARRYRDHYRLKALLAQECARLMADEGIKDFRTAKRKAALDFEKAYLERVLERAKGSISAASRIAGIDRTNFRRLLQRHGIDSTRFRG